MRKSQRNEPFQFECTANDIDEHQIVNCTVTIEIEIGARFPPSLRTFIPFKPLKLITSSSLLRIGSKQEFLWLNSNPDWNPSRYGTLNKDDPKNSERKKMINFLAPIYWACV